VHSKINFSKCTSTKHFTSSVKLRLSFRRFVSFLKCFFYCIGYFNHFSNSRTYWQTLFSRFFVSIVKNILCNVLSWQLTNSQCFLCDVYWSLIAYLCWLWLIDWSSYEWLSFYALNLKIILIISEIINSHNFLLIIFVGNIGSLHHYFSLFSCYLLLFYWELITHGQVLTNDLVSSVIFVEVCTSSSYSWRFLRLLLNRWLTWKCITLRYSDFS